MPTNTLKPTNEIPPMTDPLGRYWDQPDPKGILTDDNYAVMDKKTFDELSDYTQSQPTGAYPGKMWKAKQYISEFNEETKKHKITGWYWGLCWFGDHSDPKFVSNHCRAILIMD